MNKSGTPEDFGYFSDGQMEAAVRKMVTLGGYRNWKKRYEALTRADGRAIALERHHVEVVVFEAFRRIGLTTRILAGRMPELDGYAVASEISAWHDELSEFGKKNLAGRVRNALDEDWGFSPLRTEMTARLFLRSIGCSLVSSDLEGADRWDFLARRGADEIELECKYLTHDFGRSYRIREFQRLRRLLGEFADTQEGAGVSLVVRLELGQGLPRDEQQLRRIGKAVEAVVRRREAARLDDLGIGVAAEEWPPGIEEPDLVHAEARFRTDVELVATIAVSRPKFALLVELEEPLDPDSFRNRFIERLCDAAGQLSANRPGVLFVEQEGPGPGNRADGPGTQFVRDLLPRVFERRPHLELVILGFPGPPFSLGTAVHIRNPAMEHSYGNSILESLQNLSGVHEVQDAPFIGFRQAWWAPKYSPDLAARRNVQELIDRVLERLERRKRPQG